MTLLTILLTGVLAWPCSEELVILNVRETLKLDFGYPMYTGNMINVDPQVGSLPADSTTLVDLMIYPTGATIDWIFTVPVGDLDKYPQYAEQIAQARDEGMSLLPIIADSLYNGDLGAAEAHVKTSGADLVQQFEFERRQIIPYLKAAGLSVESNQVERRSRLGWIVKGLTAEGAVKFAQFARERKGWVDGLEIYKAGSVLTDCSTGKCTIRR